MEIQIIKDRSALENYFRQDLSLHLYSLGDLDDFYWPRSHVYGLRTETGVKTSPCYTEGIDLPVLLAFGPWSQIILNYAQSHCFPTVSTPISAPDWRTIFLDDYQIENHGAHFKMAWLIPIQFKTQILENTFQLTEADLLEVEELYEESYPDNAFDPRMLLTGQYIWHTPSWSAGERGRCPCLFSLLPGSRPGKYHHPS